MKLRFISSALAAALFAATGSYAAVVDGGTIHFEGELVNAACSVNTDSADQVVTLGQYRTDIFNAVGGSDSNLLIVFYVQIMPDDLVMQLHR
ncbi:type 1 fimbrial protein subunit FimA, partial [Escherichia coli]|nr:type 1 fimbrial protein subunit FimA [Escherichia coli]